MLSGCLPSATEWPRKHRHASRMPCGETLRGTVGSEGRRWHSQILFTRAQLWLSSLRARFGCAHHLVMKPAGDFVASTAAFGHGRAAQRCNRLRVDPGVGRTQGSVAAWSGGNGNGDPASLSQARETTCIRPPCRRSNMGGGYFKVPTF